MVANLENFPLLAELLSEQQRLDTPVARFSSAHDSGSVAQLSALNFQLIPLTAPQSGEQYAFEVDLDSCTGCKSCVAACHSLNGLDDTETWRDVGLLVSPSRAHPFTQTVTTACHHCADPACLNGCPVLAYEKDPVTSIVVHLDDQCIGCSYCVLKCPYDVPKFSERLGIVRKCDMCHSRLADGEAPACAQASPTHAIKIVTVPVPSLLPHLPSPNSDSRSPISTFLPGAPDPSYTQPTTRYISKRPLPENLVAADARTLRPQPAHWPLAIMLTLLPAAVGLQIVAASSTAIVTYYVTSAAGSSRELVTYYVTIAAAALGAAGLGASVFHLGQPLRAWRIFLGWRKSWLSREALVFGPWFALTAAAPLLHWTMDLRHWSFSVAAAATGLLGLCCSAMIYIDTHRHFWRASQTVPRFFGTAAAVGLAMLDPRAAALLLLGKLAWESRTYFDGSVSARLQRGPLAAIVATRDLLGLAALIMLVVSPSVFALIPLLAGELAERLLFFRAVDAPKMPGLPA
ncbi:MAG: molybdopterin oxidoreductase [Opitutus sp.]|nr:molybdopterin oxidoreductase [Opitutus sp.]